MVRYVETDEFEKLIKPYATDDRVEMAFYIFAHHTMEQVPTADVRENVHGKWIKWGSEFKCNQCHICNRVEKPFCPNCGAKMDYEVEYEKLGKE